MRRALARTLGASLLAFAGSCGAAPPDRVPPRLPGRAGPEWIAGTGAWLETWAQRSGFAGVLLVAQRGEVLVERAVGRVGTGPARIEERLDIGSIAKTMCAVVVLRLCERGVLGLEDALAEHLPEIRGRPAGAVTLRQLLAHTAGLIDHQDVPGFFERGVAGPVSRAELLELVRDQPLRFAPGTDQAYSNFGYACLALACEAATGASWGRLLEEELFVPAGMTSALWVGPGCDPGLRPPGATLDLDGTLRPAPDLFPVADLGGGDVLASARDLLRFDRALVEGRLLPRAWRERLWRPVALDDAGGRGYGLGWEVRRTSIRTAHGSRTVELVGHGGLSLGHVALYQHELEQDLVVVLLSCVRPTDDVLNNVTPPDVRRMASELVSAVHGVALDPPRPSFARALLARLSEVGFEAALAELDARLSDDPRALEVVPEELMLAGYHVLEPDPRHALLLGERARAAAPDSWLLLEALSDFRVATGDRAGALEAYRAALARAPERAYLIERLAELGSAGG